MGKARHWLATVCAAAVLGAAPAAAETLNVYTAWPESLSQPIFKAYTARTGVQVNFIRLSTGELIARATAERNTPRADLIWGAPGDGFAAAKEAGIIEPYRPPTWNRIPAELKDREGYFTAVAKNTLVFMSNAKLLQRWIRRPRPHLSLERSLANMILIAQGIVNLRE